MSDACAGCGRSTDELVGRITDEFLERLGRGERPQAEDYARRYPEVASVILQVFPALEVMRRPPIDPTPPAELLGDFRILREVGRGGMGVVYEAEQVSLGRRVALKLLPLGAAMDHKQLQRFQLEAQAAACLHHTNIVPVYAVGFELGVPFYAMQYIEGASLAQLIAELRRHEGLDPADKLPARPADVSTSTLAALLAGGRFEGPGGLAGEAVATDSAGDLLPDRSMHDESARLVVSEPASRPLRPDAASSSGSSIRGGEYARTVARFGVQVAEALDHAHTRGILHRDIKPANLLLDAGGQLWVTDFGLAQIQGNAGLTMTGDLLGTLRYMSPEQALGKRVVVDGRTDLYSLGVTLYELLTLRPAVDGEDRAEVLRNISQEAAPLRRVNPTVPRDLETVVLKAMAKEPGGRYATAKELAEDLRRFLEHRTVMARRPSALDHLAKWARRHRSAVAAGAAGAVMASAVLAASLGWIVRDRAARSEVIEREVRRALKEASAFQVRARWPEALEATKRAEGFLAGGGGEPFRTRAREIRRDLEMVLRLEEIRLPIDLSGPEGVHDDEWIDASYAEAFREFGIDLAALEPMEAVERVRGGTIGAELALALDHWAQKRKKLSNADHPDWRRLVAVARAADPDPWRNRVRDALESRDAGELALIAASARVADLPVQTLTLLVEALDAPTGEAVLRQAQRRYPDDFWINFQLGWDLDHGPRPRLDEAVRFYTAALALRPRNATTHYFLARDLHLLGRVGEAISEYGEAVALQPGGAWAPNNLAWILATAAEVELRDPRRAVELAGKAVALDPRSGESWNTLGVALYREGEWKAAIEALEKSEKLRGGDGFDWFFLAMARWRLGDCDKARDYYDRAVAWMGKNQPDDEELRRFRAEAEGVLRLGPLTPRGDGAAGPGPPETR